MTDFPLFVFVAAILLGGCAFPDPDISARERDAQFNSHSMARAQALNDWWSK